MAEKTVEKTRKYLQPHYAVRESKDGKLQLSVEMPVCVRKIWKCGWKTTKCGS